MSYRKIQAALDARLLTSNETRIAFPGRPFRPAHGAAFVAVEFRPAPVEAIFLGPGAPEHHRDTYRLTLHDHDAVSSEGRLDAFRSHFNRGRILTFVLLDGHLEGASMAAAEGDLRRTAVRLDIFWRSYFLGVYVMSFATGDRHGISFYAE